MAPDSSSFVPRANWTCRPVVMADGPHIASHRYFLAEDPTEDRDVYATWLKPRIDDGRYVGYVAESEGTIIGGAGAVLLDWGPTRGQPCPLRGRIVNVYVAHPWRRQGIARSLVSEVLAACRRQGIEEFCVGAAADAAALYRELGFRPYGHEMVIKRSHS